MIKSVEIILLKLLKMKLIKKVKEFLLLLQKMIVVKQCLLVKLNQVLILY